MTGPKTGSRSELFGPNRFYLDVKKKIGAKGGLRNIPDGYLLDLNGRKPRLYVVENELASHEPLRFEPFLEDLGEDVRAADAEPKVRSDRPDRPDVSDVDTVVVPAREQGFQDVFLGENNWRAIRLHGTMRPQIKYIAAYQVAPISAITHIAPVKSIEPWKDTGKFVVNFTEPAKQIGPIPLVKGSE